MSILRQNLLQGRAVRVSAPGAVRDLLAALGAELSEARPEDGRTPLHALVHDAGSSFGSGGAAALQGTLEEVWSAVAAVANGALIGAGKGGKIVLIAPRAHAGEFAGAARSALENLARTLSVEWARYGITTTAILPASSVREDDLATLIAFLLSPAGDYYSGCRFELGVR